ncbi:MAG: penicillin acylase family protein [Anaerolineales bacterium]
MRSRRWLRVLLVALAVVALIAFGAWELTTRSFPQHSGQVEISGLDGSVEVLRSAQGVPHIYARSEHDLFFAQGYTHAQDRFWQMDFFRHVGRGRLAEMFGPSQLETDIFLQTLGWERIAQQEFEQLDPESRRALESYSQGVNAYLNGRRPGQISLEYMILSLLSPDYRIQPWHPVDTLTWAKSMAWDLGSNMDGEIDRAILLDQLTLDQVNRLYPPYPADHPVIVPSGGQASNSDPLLPYADVPGTELAHQLRHRLSALSILRSASLEGIGSNNWVIGPGLTESGSPILANDTHLGIQMPSIWYENGLHCMPQGDDCQLQVAGFSFAGAPGVVIGHNERIAWGVTNADPDVQDLFIEQLDPAQPDHYLFQGEWRPMEVHEQQILVAGQDAVTIQVRQTHHGPLITDRYGALEDLVGNRSLNLPEEYGLALRWTALDHSSLISAILQLNRAQDWESFRQALAGWDVPSQNVIYADVDGNIGYQLPGRIPIRRSGQGWLPNPGWTGEFEWEGMIPYEELPSAFNPESQFIATANNAIAGDAYSEFLSQDWDYGYRASRIEHMIRTTNSITIADVQGMHGDNQHPMGEILIPHLVNLELGGDAGVWVSRLEAWDHQNHMDSGEAAVFNAFWRNLHDWIFLETLGEAPLPRSSRAFTIVHDLLDEPNSQWWDLSRTAAIETRDQALELSFLSALSELHELLGRNQQAWRWGDMHTATFRNQSLGKSGVPPIEWLFNRGPYPTGGGTSIVNATGWKPQAGYEVTSLPSQRIIHDLSDWDLSSAVHTTGQSGHAFHPNYSDQVDPWRWIEYHPLPWAREQVLDQSTHRLELLPE